MIDRTAFIHPQAIVENDCIGARTTVYAFVHILPGARVGCDCNINDHCFVEGDVVLGDRVTVKCGNFLWNGLRVEDDAFLGPNVVYTNDPTPRSKRYPDTFLPITIRRGASIGANSVLLGGITVGRYALIGMGSVVTRDVPDFGLVYGNPARLRGYVCMCGERLATTDPRVGVPPCGKCGLRYEFRDGSLHRLEPEAE